MLRPFAPAVRLVGVLPEVAVATVALAVFSWRVGAPSASRDEATTMSVASRSILGIVWVTRRIDLVHAVHYLLAHGALLVAAGLHTDGLTTVRWVSVLAMSGAAVVLVRIGRTLGSTAIGVVAGLLLVASPLASRYGQDARSYALVTLFATLSGWALVNAQRSGRGWEWIGYAAAVAGAVLLNVLAVLVLTWHAAYVVAASIATATATGSGAATDALVARRVLRGMLAWLAALTVAAVVVARFMLAAFLQRNQVDFLTTPAPRDLLQFAGQEYPLRVTAVTLIAATVGAVLLSRRVGSSGSAGSGAAGSGSGSAGSGSAGSGSGGSGLGGLLGRPGWARRALLLGAAWAVLPPVTLFLVSQLHPFWHVRYALSALPGAALLMATLVVVPGRLLTGRPLTGRSLITRPVLARRVLWTLPAAVLVLAVAVAGVPRQLAYRSATQGHESDLRAVAAYVGRVGRPGDAVLFVPGHGRDDVAAYPAGFAAVTDVMLAVSPARSNTLDGVQLAPARVRAALVPYRRVWVVLGPWPLDSVAGATERAEEAALRADYTQVSRAAFAGAAVEQFVRRP